MAKAFQFQFLLKMAEDKREDAARQISLAIQKMELARDRQQQIEQYREEYRQRLANTAAKGMKIYQWHDFQLFLGKLDTAVEQQTLEHRRSVAWLENCKQAWLRCEQEVKAYETLRDRHDQRENLRAAKADQRQTDEWASILHQRKG